MTISISPLFYKKIKNFYKNFFEFGGGYKSIGYAYLMGMVKLKMGIDIGYATDFGTGNTASNNRSGFEIFAKYRF